MVLAVDLGNEIWLQGGDSYLANSLCAFSKASDEAVNLVLVAKKC